mgnify:CR=1 FL=1
MDTKKIIELHGGCTALSKLVGVSPQCVYNWKKRGIPARMKLKYPHLFLNQKELARDLA